MGFFQDSFKILWGFFDILSDFLGFHGILWGFFGNCWINIIGWFFEDAQGCWREMREWTCDWLRNDMWHVLSLCFQRCAIVSSSFSTFSPHFFIDLWHLSLASWQLRSFIHHFPLLLLLHHFPLLLLLLHFPLLHFLLLHFLLLLLFGVHPRMNRLTRSICPAILFSNCKTIIKESSRIRKNP